VEEMVAVVEGKVGELKHEERWLDKQVGAKT
jgi:hypothetical protein